MVGFVRTFGDPQTFTATIAADAATSDAVDVGGRGAFAIELPDAWDTANVTFLASRTATGTFKSILNSEGSELVVTGSTNAMLSLGASGDLLKPYRFIKVRSGTSETPVEQAAERTVYILSK